MTVSAFGSATHLYHDMVLIQGSHSSVFFLIGCLYTQHILSCDFGQDVCACNGVGVRADCSQGLCLLWSSLDVFVFCS